jgi:hypothetical protein
MSSSVGIGSTLTAGIQDIAAFLPLLGTEQCSEQVSSALTRGYLYAASAPMSLFGSLGVVSAGFKTLAACFTFGKFEGAKKLGNMGFVPQGENLSLIMVEVGVGNNACCHIIETRMDELIKELNIDKNRITGVSKKCVAWNVKMTATTALFCAFSITPYIYLNLAPNNLNTSTRWVFPILRAIGGFFTATFIQLLIQRRITTLSEQYLVVKQDQLLNRDVEAAVEPKKHRMDVHTRLLVWPLFFGLIASVVGYVGCFSVVQNSTTTTGPLSWLCLEAGLSVMRLSIWAWNPKGDDAPPLEIILELDKYEDKPLPTCNKDNAEILKYKLLPLTRARDFLKVITSFAGLIEPFGNPDLTLYYTLTRNRVNESEIAELGERTLYITVFDHKERTTRVYTRDNEVDTFYSTKPDAPHVDVGHFLLEVEIDAKIDPKGDPVSSDSNILESLQKHHQSILEHIQYRLGLGDADVTRTYTINNSWTMKVKDTISTLQKLREENGDEWEAVVEKGREEERTEDSKLLAFDDYFMHSSIERERRLLDEKRVKWISRRMEMITKETKERLLGIGVEYRINKQAVEKKPATKSPEEIEKMLGREQCMMEVLLVCEVREWEHLFWSKFKAFRDQIGKDRKEEKERLTREWRANCWKRLNPQMHATLKRWEDVDMIDKDTLLESLSEEWAKSIRLFFEGVADPDLISVSELREEIIHLNDETRIRMEKEIEDTEFRLKRGSDLGRFDQFWDDYDILFECRYSRSKWLHFDFFIIRPAPLEIYSHALKGNKNIIHIIFGEMDSGFDVNQLLCDLPWVTSMLLRLQPTLPAIIHRDLLFIKSSNNDLNTFLEKIRPELDDIDSTYIFTDAEGSDIGYPGKLVNSGRVLISFVAPTSGKSLILRLKHSGEKDAPLEVTLGSTKIQLNPSSESSLTIDDITLYPTQVPGSSESDLLLFEPEIRNDIFIQFRGAVKFHGHFLHDIELLDEAGLEYNMPRSPSLSKLSN